MNQSWRCLGEVRCRRVPTQEGMSLSCKWGYLWIVPIQSHPAAMRFRHRGRVLPSWYGAALQYETASMDEIGL
jgi:hypothetical protein